MPNRLSHGQVARFFMESAKIFGFICAVSLVDPTGGTNEWDFMKNFQSTTKKLLPSCVDRAAHDNVTASVQLIPLKME